MSQSSSSSKKMLDSLNEIDPVAFYTSSNAPSPSKMLTISSVNIDETSLLNPQSFLDLNNPAPVPGPCAAMLSDHLFKGDLPKNKSSESNILAASESLVVESLTQMMGGILSEKREHKPSSTICVNRGFWENVCSDMDIIMKPGMDSLHDLTKSHVLHEEEVIEFYYNIEFTEDGSIHSRVGDKSLHLNEDLLGHILEGTREGIRYVVGKTYSMKFVKECSKIPNTRRAGVQKKLMKGEYQLLFEFVNKVLLPRTETRTVASATDLFIMESLCKFEPRPSFPHNGAYVQVCD
ncbi:hypothetical protein H5410_013906 [Solanum commersonii]|uniref:Uncharacterized protein n=1 Tax=Solanum commersonii TaxID=4109 RepID=A0A9J5ZPT0_SOLCO|nr:hypothetical protein H5410_013906 [Solanum commersonii]